MKHKLKRINRIRLEFKVVTHLKGVQGLVGINRIRLEFKGKRKRLPNGFGSIGLIESDWNLKFFDRRVIVAEHGGLIESDWNLKESSDCRRPEKEWD